VTLTNAILLSICCPICCSFPSAPSLSNGAARHRLWQSIVLATIMSTIINNWLFFAIPLFLINGFAKMANGDEQRHEGNIILTRPLKKIGDETTDG
jgi:hypothetical protein